jgi:PKD domain/Secretion system C-terminal sorting domain
MTLSRLIIIPFLCIGNLLYAQVLADFETPASTPVLTPAGASVVANPDVTGNSSTNVAYYQKTSGNWHAIYLDFAAAKNIGSNDRLTFKLRSSTQGRVFVKVVNGSTTILENWAPDYNTQPQVNQWTECSLDISTIGNQPFNRIEINASVDNEAVANVYLDDVKLVNSKSLNGEPVLNLGVSDYQITQGETVTFDASGSTDSDGTIVSYTWDFKDGTSVIGPTATVAHTFSTQGIFKVRVTIEDNDGKKSGKTVPINVLPTTGKFGTFQITTNQPRTFEKIEGVFLVNETYSNVYNPDIIKIDAAITQPDESVIHVPCFFYQDASYSPDQWIRNDNTGYWMLRFSASQTGQHEIQLTLTDSEGTVTSASYDINVSASTEKGFIKMDPDNKQYFRHTTGQPYYPLGINVAWNNTTNYTTILNNLGEGGANLVRYWQVPFDRQGLEWKNGSGFYKGLGVYSQEAAAEQDSIISLCEANDLFLQLTLFQHGMFSENVNSNWADNPYKSSNGGPLTLAEQFFYNAQAKTQTKKLLRYIVARWGYSTHLFAWELFNEVNFTGVHPNQSAQWYPGVKTWHDEMGQYIKELDAFDHPVTTSSDESHLADFDKLMGLDNVQYHLYNTSLLSTQDTKDQSILNEMTRVGLLNGEYGLDVNTADVPFDVQRISIWTGIMNQVPHLMWKWDNYTNPQWANLFQYPADFLEDEDFTSEAGLSDLEMSATYNTEILGTAGFKSDESFYGIVYDKIHRSNHTGASVDLSSTKAGNYTIAFTDILTGAQSELTTDVYSELSLPTFSKGISFKGKLNYEIILATENENRNDVHVYPNPTSDKIFVNLKQETATEIEIINVIGARLTLRDATDADSGKIEISLKDSGIQPGMHIVKITTRDKTYFRKVLYCPQGAEIN